MASPIVNLPYLDEDGYFAGTMACMYGEDGTLLLPDNVRNTAAPCEDPRASEYFYKWEGEKFVAEKKPTTCADFITFGPVNHQKQTDRWNELRQRIQVLQEKDQEHYRIQRGEHLEWIMEEIPEPTEEEKEQSAAKAEYRSCKQYLNSTDYVVLKEAEGVVSEEDTAKYAEVKAKREKARARINELEEKYPDMDWNS